MAVQVGLGIPFFELHDSADVNHHKRMTDKTGATLTFHVIRNPRAPLQYLDDGILGVDEFLKSLNPTEKGVMEAVIQNFMLGRPSDDYSQNGAVVKFDVYRPELNVEIHAEGKLR